MAASQVQESEKNRDLAQVIQQSLETVRNQELNMLMQAFSGIHTELHLSNELMAAMQSRQNSLDGRLQGLDQSFLQLEQKAASFQAAQEAQVELQTRLQDALQTDMYVTRGLLAEVTTHAANLQTTVEETAKSLSQLAGLSGIGSALFRWSWVLMAIVAVSLFSRRAATIFGLLFSKFFPSLPDRRLSF